jgi:hypothetical protein
MVRKSIGKTILLSLLVLSIVVEMHGLVIPRVHAAGGAIVQNGPTTWSPFGPRTGTAILTIHGDSIATFNDFVTGRVPGAGGGLDITDWPVSPTNEASFATNPDYFLAQVNDELGIYQLEINHNTPFLGVYLQQSRTYPTPFAIVKGATPGCSSGTGQLIVTLRNLEEGGALIVDGANTITANPVGSSGTPVTVHDADNGPLDGIYTLPSPTGCMTATSYNLSTSVYSGTVGVSVVGGQVTSIDLGVKYNSPSIAKPTPAGTEISKGIAHLIDKPNFILGSVVSGEGVYDDIPVAPTQGLTINGVGNSKLPQSVIDEDCSEHTWFNPGSCHPVSAYDLVSDSIGPDSFKGRSQNPGVTSTGYSGTEDLRAACDHFKNAGFSIVGGSDCSAVAAGTAHLDNKGLHIVIQIGNDKIRKALGQIMADSLNFLFGTPAPAGGGTICYQFSLTCFTNPDQAFYHSFDADGDQVYAPSNTASLLNLYTSYRVLDSSPDQLVYYHSMFASDICGGKKTFYAQNYFAWCDPAYDTQVSAFGGLPSDPFNPLGSAALIAYRKAMTVPVLSSHGIKYAALNGWNFQNPANALASRSSLVNQLGHGFQPGFWSLLNMRQVPGYMPSNAAYTPGGGNPDIIRRSVTQTLSRLSPFQARTPWELEIISLIYDSLLKVNPETGGMTSQAIDWMTTYHTSSYDSNTQTTTQVWHLRNDLFFHDGRRIIADDVVYTILAYRDVPSFFFYPNVARVLTAVSTDTSTIKVTISGQSLFDELNIGTLPILPKLVWASWCLNPPSPSSSCADRFFDPMAPNGNSNAGIMIGSGPWVCKNVNTGSLGGSCTQNASSNIGGQTVTEGGRVPLVAYNGYFRGRPPPTPGTPLKFDAKVRFVDTNNNNVWDTGGGFESVVYDSNNNGVYDAGEPVIAGTVPAAGTALKSDPKLKFFDSITVDNIWDPGEPVLYDSNANGVYDQTEPVISGARDTSLHQISWADKNDDGVVNILDMADINFVFGKPDPYWNTGQNSAAPTAGGDPRTVDIVEVSMVAAYYGAGITSPFFPSELVGLDSCIDPFFGTSAICP